MMKNVSSEDFPKVEIGVGTMLEEVQFHEAKNPSYKTDYRFLGGIRHKKTAAQNTVRYSLRALIGKQIVAVVNFSEKQMANIMSECLELGAVEGNDVTVLEPRENGLRKL